MVTEVFPLKVGVEDELPPQPVVKTAAKPTVEASSKRKQREIGVLERRGSVERMSHPFRFAVKTALLEGRKPRTRALHPRPVDTLAPSINLRIVKGGLPQSRKLHQRRCGMGAI
jgi:hypothetical protein